MKLPRTGRFRLIYTRPKTKDELDADRLEFLRLVDPDNPMNHTDPEWHARREEYRDKVAAIVEETNNDGDEVAGLAAEVLARFDNDYGSFA